ncbi:MAG TPA: hypothetical protein VF058_11685 [Actinomycetota bacterium]
MAHGDGSARDARSSGRIRAFRVIAVVMAVSAIAFGLFTAIFGAVSESQEIHAYHNVIVASLLLVLSVPPVVAAAREPEGAAPHLVHLVTLGVAAVATMAIALMADVFTLPFVALAGVLLLLRVPREPAVGAGRPSIPLAIVVAVAAVPLLAYAIDQAGMQRVDDASEHAQLNHWVEVAFYAAAIPLLGALAAIRPRVFRLAGLTAGAALAILGGGSLLLEGYPSSPDPPWGWAALGGGLLLLGLVEWEARRRASPDRVSAT